MTTELPAERPPGVPPDPWAAFATATERPPGRPRRAARAVGRALTGEYAVAAYLSCLAAAVLTWPTLRYPRHALPGQDAEAARQAWQVAWSGHSLRSDPTRLWQANTHAPLPDAYASGDTLLGYAPAGLLGSGPHAAVLRFVLLYVAAHALLSVGGYALIRQLGAGRIAATVGAAAVTYAPWRMAEAGHLDVVSVGGVPLALALLARGHGWSLRHGLRPGRRHAGWAAAGWLVVAWQLALGFSTGLPLICVLAVVLFVAAVGLTRWRLTPGRPAALGWRLILVDVAGAALVTAVGVPLALALRRAPDPVGAASTVADLSPTLRGLLVAPAESRIWGAAHAEARAARPGAALLPGFGLIALALAGLVFSIWTWRQRLVLVLATAAAVVLTLGGTVAGGRWTYLPLFGRLPAAFGVRDPARLMLWVTLLLAVLAAGAVADFARRADQLSRHRMPPRPGPALRLATLLPVLLVLAEGWPRTPTTLVPPAPAALAASQSGPTLVLPTGETQDAQVALWSTAGFPAVANGSGRFAADRQAELRGAVAAFPDAASVQYLRTRGVRTVLLWRPAVAGTPWERSGDVPVDGLGVTRTDVDDDTVRFDLELPSGP